MPNSRGTSSSPPAPAPAPAPGSSSTSTSTSTFTLSQAFLAYTGDDLEPDITSSRSTYDDDNEDDYDDDDEFADIGHQSQTATSFEHLKLKTLQSLYGIQVLKKKKNKILNKSIKADMSTFTYTYNLSLLRDKSPKGSVDEGIRSLVDLLNAHPCFSTLSSCSGRITLFDPAAGSSGVVSGVVSGVGSGSDSRSGNDDNDDNDDGQNDEEDITSSSQVKSGKGYGTWLLSCHNTITTKQLYDALEHHHHHQHQQQQQQQQQHQLTLNNLHYYREYLKSSSQGCSVLIF